MTGASAFPLTFEQESIWVADQFAGSPSPYLETWAQRFRGPLDIRSLEWALTAIVARHPALRSQFLLVGDEPVQRVLPHRDIALQRLAWPGESVDEVLHRAGERPLDIRDSPIRLTLFERSPGEHILLVQCHHIVVDDASLSLLSADLEAFYTSSLLGSPAQLPELPQHLGEYAVRQRALGVPASSLDYWKGYLDGAPPLPDLPPRRRVLPRRRGNRCGRVTTSLTGDAASRVRRLARDMRTTPNVVFSASLAVSVAACVDAGDVVIGNAISRRGAAEITGVFGCLTDMLPLRLAVDPGSTFADVCAATKRGVLASLRHRDVPYAAIVKATQSARAVLSGQGLLRMAIVVDDDGAPPLRLPGLECERIYVAPAAAKFDWCTYVVADGEDYLFLSDYAADYFTREQALATMGQWTRTLAEAAANPQAAVATIGRLLKAMA